MYSIESLLTFQKDERRGLLSFNPCNAELLVGNYPQRAPPVISTTRVNLAAKSWLRRSESDAHFANRRDYDYRAKLMSISHELVRYLSKQFLLFISLRYLPHNWQIFRSNAHTFERNSSADTCGRQREHLAERLDSGRWRGSDTFAALTALCESVSAAYGSVNQDNHWETDPVVKVKRFHLF